MHWESSVFGWEPGERRRIDLDSFCLVESSIVVIIIIVQIVTVIIDVAIPILLVTFIKVIIIAL